MTRIMHILLIMGLVSCFHCAAQIVTPRQARLAARNFMQANAMQHPDSLKELQYTYVKQNNGINTYYVVQYTNGGFVLLSASRDIVPILGYSESGTFPVNDLPPALSYWINCYEEQIVEAWHDNYKDKQAREAWDHYLNMEPVTHSETIMDEGVKPLLHSAWEQGAYYNACCPADPSGPGGHVYTGCVATAMAQVLYYYRHPLTGKGSVSYFDPDYGTIGANFGETYYRWNEMVPWIMGQENPAIAELIYHCGVSVRTYYGANGSGANTADCAQALAEHFDYRPDLAYYYRSTESTKWTDTLMANLDRGMPVIYRGGPFWSAHCFVCDGYANSSYFHFNFGWWQGNGNGYYYLEDLTPFHYSFTEGQAGVFNIFPDGEYPPIYSGTNLLTNSRGSFTDGSGPGMYHNNMDCSWLISPDTGEGHSIMLYFNSFDTEKGLDLITVYDGEHITAPVIAKYSGQDIPPALASSGGRMLVRFTSNGHNQAGGWSAHYTTVDGPYCQSWSHKQDTAGYVYDGSWIIYDYTNNSDCYWLIDPEVPEHDSISGYVFSFTEFETEAGADYLRIYDGPTVNDPLLAELSGCSIPAEVRSSNDQVLLRFSSDGQNTYSGFMGSFHSIYPDYCQDTVLLSASSGMIDDGSNDKYYNHYSDCYWAISPPEAEYINLTFLEFDVESGYDWLRIMDASGSEPLELALLTGEEIPGPFNFKTGKILLHFHTDHLIKKAGWRITYTANNLGIDMPGEKTFALFPNPTTDITTIRCKTQDARYKMIGIYTIEGRKIWEQETSDDEIVFNADGLPSGVYIVKMQSGNNISCKKLAIKTN